MGLSLSTLWNLWKQPREVRIVLIGLDAAGKSVCLSRLKTNETVTTIPTIGFNVETVEYKNLKLQMFDVGGQYRLRGLWHHYYENSDAVIFMVDSADKARIGEAQKALQDALESDHLRNATLLVYANKQDMPQAMSVSEVSEKLKLRDMCSNRKFFVQGSTATIGAGLYEGLDWLSSNLPKISK